MPTKKGSKETTAGVTVASVSDLKQTRAKDAPDSTKRAIAKKKNPPKKNPKKANSKRAPKKEPPKVNPFEDRADESFMDYVVPDAHKELLWEIGTGEEECSDPKVWRYARRYVALFMRTQGYQYQAIASTMGVTVSAVSNLVHRALKDTVSEEADAVRARHMLNYENMMTGLAERAMAGDTFAVEKTMQIMARVEKLMGIAAPEEINLNIVKDSPADELRAKVAAIRRRAESGGDAGEPAS